MFRSSVSATESVVNCFKNHAGFLAGSAQGVINVIKEYDSEEREAEVFLFKAPVEGVPDMGGLVDPESLCHYALVFKLEGGHCRTAEGVPDDENRIAPCYTSLPPQKEGKYYKLGQVDISPKKLRDMVMSNEYNGQIYLATANNCQDWVRDLGSRLGVAILQELQRHKTLMEVNPLVGIFGALAGSLQKHVLPGTRPQ